MIANQIEQALTLSGEQLPTPIHEYLCDSIDGGLVLDSVGTQDLTNVACTVNVGGGVDGDNAIRGTDVQYLEADDTFGSDFGSEWSLNFWWNQVSALPASQMWAINLRKVIGLFILIRPIDIVFAIANPSSAIIIPFVTTIPSYNMFTVCMDGQILTASINDGVSVSFDIGATPVVPSPQNYYGLFTTASASFRGTKDMDLIRWYDKKLTDQERTALYNGGLGA